MKKRFAVLLLAACATTQNASPEETKSVKNPPLESAPTREAPPAVGWFPLPAALNGDPRKLPIAPLDLTITRPKKTKLPNGLTVYTLEDHATPLISVRAIVWSGGFDDTDAKLGTAELTADLLASGGTQALEPDAVDALFEQVAADVGGSANDEVTTVSMSLRSLDLPKLLPVFADMLQKPRFDKGRFDVTAGRVLESIRRRTDRPDGLASRALTKAIFGPSTLLGRESTEATIKAITPADLKAHHAKTFSPQATSLLISGDFDPAQIDKQVAQLFGAWKGGKRVARVLPAPPTLQRRVIVVPKATPQAKVRIGGLGFSRASDDEYPMRLVSASLGSFGVGRLYQQIRDQRGLAYSAWSSASPGPTTGTFTAGFDTRPEQVVPALELALQILDGAAGPQPITAPELSTAADMTLNSFAFRFDQASKIIWERAVFDFFGYPDDYLETYRSKVSAVNLEAAQAAVKKLARSDQLQIVIVGPVDKMGDLSKFGAITVVKDVEQFR